MASDAEVRDLFEKYENGELTEVQLNFWIEDLKIPQEQIDQVYKEMDKKDLTASVFWFAIYLALGSLVIWMVAA